MQTELSELTIQDNVVQNKNVNDLYNNLKTLTPMLKTSHGSADVHNRVYNIIDYLRTNRHITRDQYHKYINNIYYNIIYKWIYHFTLIQQSKALQLFMEQILILQS